MNPKQLVGTEGGKYVFEILNSESPEILMEKIGKFRRNYLHLPQLQSFSFEDYAKLTNDILNIPISSILLPVFNTLKSELLSSQRNQKFQNENDSNESSKKLDSTIFKILPYVNLPLIEPIFFALLKLSKQPEHFYYVFEKIPKLLDKCPKSVVLRIWKRSSKVFRKFFMESLLEYLEKFQNLDISNSTNNTQLEEIIDEFLRDIDANKTLISESYDFLRPLFLNPPKNFKVANNSTSSSTKSENVVREKMEISKSEIQFSRIGISSFYIHLMEASGHHKRYEVFSKILRFLDPPNISNIDDFDDTDSSLIIHDFFEKLKIINFEIYEILDRYCSNLATSGGVKNMNEFLMDLKLIIFSQKSKFLEKLLECGISELCCENFKVLEKIGSEEVFEGCMNNIYFNNFNQENMSVSFYSSFEKDAKGVKNKKEIENEKMKDEDEEFEISENKNVESVNKYSRNLNKNYEIWFVIKSIYSFLMFSESIGFGNSVNVKKSVEYLFFHSDFLNVGNLDGIKKKQEIKEIVWKSIQKLQQMLSFGEASSIAEVQEMCLNEIVQKL